MTILLADDDAGDCQLIIEALAENYRVDNVHVVADGEQLLDYLHRRGSYADPTKSPRPGLILLDLNMPRMNGYEAIDAIKATPSLRQIPIVVMTTSHMDEDIERSYDLGVSSYITKPSSFKRLVEVMRTLGKYWFEIVRLPGWKSANADDGYLPRNGRF